MIIGITGGSGCGKTTALRAIKELGGLVLDCDEIYHQLLASSPALLSAIDRRFPGTVERGRLNREALGKWVFSEPSSLDALNAITHPAVKTRVMELLSPSPSLAAIDAIALFEGGLAEICDVTVAVTAPEETRVARLMARDDITREQALRRIHAQKSQEAFRAQCDYCLENNTTAQDFSRKCLAFFRELAIINAKRKGEVL